MFDILRNKQVGKMQIEAGQILGARWPQKPNALISISSSNLQAQLTGRYSWLSLTADPSYTDFEPKVMVKLKLKFITVKRR